MNEPKVIKDFPGRAVEAFRVSHGGALPGELKPCPFCGQDEAEYIVVDRHHAVRCKHCHSKSPSTATQGGARTVWNARATVVPSAGVACEPDARERLRVAMLFVEEWANWWSYALGADDEKLTADQTRVGEEMAESLGAQARDMVIDNRRFLARTPPSASVAIKWEACRAPQQSMRFAFASWACETCGASNIDPKCRYVGPSTTEGERG